MKKSAIISNPFGRACARLFIALFAILFLTLLSACGGGGGGGGSASAPPNAETPMPLPGVYRVEYVSPPVVELDSAASRVTSTVPDGYRYLTRDGVSVRGFAPVTIITPGGLSRTASGSPVFADRLFTLGQSWSVVQGGSLVGATVAERSYVADFPGHRCDGIRFRSFSGTRSDASNPTARRYDVACVNSATATLAQVTVTKTELQIYQVCWRDNRRTVYCNLHFNNNNTAIVALAFPEQTYRRDDGKCESAPFYAVDKCQRENAVDIGDFSAFVSGLNGDGYRQFGIRHRLEWDDWNVAGMVSHARGDVFADTWWTRLRADRRVSREVKGFAEYESGVTSLRQNGRVFDDLPISGGRVGFSAEDFTMSFGRPMHHKGKGENSAALHWQVNRNSNFGLMHTGGDIRARIEWRAKF